MTFQYFFFDTYIGYFLQAMPIAIIVAVAWYLLRYRKDQEISTSQKIWGTVFVCYLAGLVSLVVLLDVMGIAWYKLFYHMDPGRSVGWFAGNFNFLPDFWRHINIEVIGNFLAFIPLGFLYPLSRPQTSLKKTILVGLLCTVVIEVVQPIFGRAFDVNDIILNTLGVMASSTVFFIIQKAIRRRAS